MLYVNMCVCPHGGKQGWILTVPGELPFCVSRGSCKVTGVLKDLPVIETLAGAAVVGADGV